jgi:hypothetical protein
MTVRRFGLAVAGLVVALLDDGAMPDSVALGLLLGFLPVFLAGTGAVVAVLADVRHGPGARRHDR